MGKVSATHHSQVLLDCCEGTPARLVYHLVCSLLRCMSSVILTSFSSEEAIHGSGEGVWEVVVTHDKDVACRLFCDFTSAEELVSV